MLGRRTSPEPLRVRMGLHAGDVDLRAATLTITGAASGR